MKIVQVSMLLKHIDFLTVQFHWKLKKKTLLSLEL